MLIKEFLFKKIEGIETIFFKFHEDNKDKQSIKPSSIIIAVILNQLPQLLQSLEIHNYNKSQRKWINDSGIVFFQATCLWLFCHIDVKSMFLAFCKISKPTNDSKIRKTKANTCCNTETLNGHFKDDTAAPIMHEKAVRGERLKQKLCYIVKSQIKQNINVSCFAVFKLLNRSPRSSMQTSKAYSCY